MVVQVVGGAVGSAVGSAALRAAAASASRGILGSVGRLFGGAAAGAAETAVRNAASNTGNNPNTTEAPESTEPTQVQSTPEIQVNTTDVEKISPSQDGDIGSKFTGGNVIALLRSIDSGIKELSETIKNLGSATRASNVSAASGIRVPRAQTAGLLGSLAAMVLGGSNEAQERANEQAAEGVISSGEAANIPPRVMSGTGNVGRAPTIYQSRMAPSLDTIEQMNDALSSPGQYENPEMTARREALRQRLQGSESVRMTPEFRREVEQFVSERNQFESNMAGAGESVVTAPSQSQVERARELLERGNAAQDRAAGMGEERERQMREREEAAARARAEQEARAAAARQNQSRQQAQTQVTALARDATRALDRANQDRERANNQPNNRILQQRAEVSERNAEQARVRLERYQEANAERLAPPPSPLQREVTSAVESLTPPATEQQRTEPPSITPVEGNEDLSNNTASRLEAASQSPAMMGGGNAMGGGTIAAPPPGPRNNPQTNSTGSIPTPGITPARIPPHPGIMNEAPSPAGSVGR